MKPEREIHADISVVGVPFETMCGVRQGGILSPLLFAVYMDDLIDDLRKCGYGLYIGSVFTGAFCMLMI